MHSLRMLHSGMSTGMLPIGRYFLPDDEATLVADIVENIQTSPFSFECIPHGFITADEVNTCLYQGAQMATDMLLTAPFVLPSWEAVRVRYRQQLTDQRTASGLHFRAPHTFCFDAQRHTELNKELVLNHVFLYGFFDQIEQAYTQLCARIALKNNYLDHAGIKNNAAAPLKENLSRLDDLSNIIQKLAVLAGFIAIEIGAGKEGAWVKMQEFIHEHFGHLWNNTSINCFVPRAPLNADVNSHWLENEQIVYERFLQGVDPLPVLDFVSMQRYFPETPRDKIYAALGVLRYMSVELFGARQLALNARQSEKHLTSDVAYASGEKLTQLIKKGFTYETYPFLWGFKDSDNPLYLYLASRRDVYIGLLSKQNRQDSLLNDSVWVVNEICKFIEEDNKLSENWEKLGVYNELDKRLLTAYFLLKGRQLNTFLLHERERATLELYAARECERVNDSREQILYEYGWNNLYEIDTSNQTAVAKAENFADKISFWLSKLERQNAWQQILFREKLAGFMRFYGLLSGDECEALQMIINEQMP